MTITARLTVGLSALALFLTATITMAAGMEQPTDFWLQVDGETYAPSQISGPIRHYETPDTQPQVAQSDRHVWAGNGSEHLPCEGGIHWIDNENLLTVSHCLEVPPTTTVPPSTTTTTKPPTTTTSTTVPPTTTTTTTVPETTTTQPPEDWFTVELACDWDNHDKDQGAHEPILSWWDQGPDHDRMAHAFLYVIYDRVSGANIGAVEFNTASPGYHDTWASNEVAVPETGFIVELYHNGELHTVLDDPTCVKQTEETTTTQPPPTTTQPPKVCVDDAGNTHPDADGDGYNDETGELCRLPSTGMPLEAFALAGLILLAAGAAAVAASRQEG